MEQAEKPDTFVFAPFMLEQIEQLKNYDDKFNLLRSLCQYGCYGIYEPFEDETGALQIIFESLCRAIDKSKALRKTRQEAGKIGGKTTGKINNPNGRKGNKQKTSNN